MKKSEVALILAKAAAFDQRTVSEFDVEAWYECVSDVDFGDAMKAVTEHYRTSRERLMPADLVETCLEQREPNYTRFHDNGEQVW